VHAEAPAARESGSRNLSCDSSTGLRSASQAPSIRFLLAFDVSFSAICNLSLRWFRVLVLVLCIPQSCQGISCTFENTLKVNPLYHNRPMHGQSAQRLKWAVPNTFVTLFLFVYSVCESSSAQYNIFLDCPCLQRLVTTNSCRGAKMKYVQVKSPAHTFGLIRTKVSSAILS
jgi:hypothetical protein